MEAKKPKQNMPITKDKAINEIIDGYDSKAVPDNLVADRLDSASYMMAKQIDTDGGTTLLAAATVDNETELTKDNIYGKIVDIRTRMNKANIPNDGKRYILAVPDAMALILKSPEFISASSLGDEVKVTGAVGKIAGFLVIEWNDTTANLMMLSFYEGRYIEMTKEITPFITQCVIPRCIEIKKENQKSILNSYNRKQRMALFRR